ncbi:MAG TPA: ferric reductase-like transmembrane domain-containing protein [Gemmatimonadales bacterium]
MTAIDLSNDLGLVACFLLTFNLLLGLLLAFRYNPWTHWPHRRFNYFRLHNWTAYVALAAAVAHPVVLLFIARPTFRVIDVLLPLASPQQPVVNTIGAAALYALIFVVTTSYARHRMTRRMWKRLHYTAYAVAGSFLIHGLLADPSLRDHAIDWLDGEKVGIEICAGLLVALGVWRLGRAFKRPALRTPAASPLP